MKKKRVTFRAGAVCACVLAILCGSAFAYYTANGGGSASAEVSALVAPTITTATAGVGGTVELKWSTVSPPTGASGTVSYYVTRNNGLPAESCPDVNGPEIVEKCTDTGLNPGSYEYRVIAVWNGWSKSSAEKKVTVSVGKVTQFTVSAASATPSTGAFDALTITAKDSSNNTVTNFKESHSLVFSGASASEAGKAPSVVNAAGTAINFGEPTALTFTNGVATSASNKNGALQIYRPGEAKIVATEGSLTTPSPAILNVVATATQFVISTTSATTVNAGTAVNLGIKAYDGYGNLSTTYTGEKKLTFSGGNTSPGGKVPTVDNLSGTAVQFGTATAINFVNGVAAVTEGKNGETVLYASGAQAIKATESAVTTPTGLTFTVNSLAPVGLSLSGTTSFATTTGSALTVIAKDTYGNSASSYTGEKKLTFAATGTASETSPGGTVPGVVNTAGEAKAFGTSTTITFTNGTATSTSSKNGYLRLYKVGTANITVSDGTFTSAAVTFTATIGAAKRVSISSISSSAGTISNPCFFSCSVTSLGNSGTVTAALTITDEYGNPISNIGSGKTVTVTSTSGSTVSGGTLTVAESGTATTTAKFTYTAPASNSYTNTITAASSGYTSATITTTK